MVLFQIFKIIPAEFGKKLRLNLLFSILNQLLDFFSIILLVPIMSALFSPESLQAPFFRNLNVSAHFQSHGLEMLLAVLFFFAVKNFISVKITRYQSDYYYSLSNALSVDLLRSFMRKDLAQIRLEKNSSIIKDMVYVPNNFVIYVLSSVVQLLSETVLLSLILACAFIINPWLSLCLMAISTAMITALYYYDRRQLVVANETISQKYDSNFNHLFNAVNGFTDIKINQLSDFFVAKFTHSNQELNRLYSILNTSRLTKPRYTETFLMIAICSLFIFIKYVFTNNPVNLLFVSFLFAASIKIIPSVNRILIGLTNLKSNLYTVSVLEESIPFENEAAIEQTAVAFNTEIVLDDIAFGYEGSAVLFENISLTVPKGAIIGIRGGSGNGKSTLVNIMATLIAPTSGKIYCDGQQITQNNKSSFLSRIAYVAQSPFLLEGSILENLSLGDTHFDPLLLEQYLELFSLTDVLSSLPEKEHTFIGSHGHTLSGGELQRVAIIRALLRNPEILILDEATNQLDPTLRENIASALRQIASLKKMTILSVSHHEKELENFCDRVYELKEGKLVSIK